MPDTPPGSVPCPALPSQPCSWKHGKQAEDARIFRVCRRCRAIEFVRTGRFLSKRERELRGLYGAAFAPTEYDRLARKLGF